MQEIYYWHEDADFEAPTLQFLYKRFIEKTQLDTTWDVGRWKVRHLKAQFRQENDCLTSTGVVPFVEADGQTIEIERPTAISEKGHAAIVFAVVIVSSESDASSAPSAVMASSTPRGTASRTLKSAICLLVVYSIKN
ncbi:unnamed protein product [Ceratitis capitata]|uniref:(Mediterranean fruit fly) hypothetical protein n=1 Tax=Ceratitis capitata TaxID=7213 RepID=A0A811V5K8_CERCA|nr:unnamed protein product [Ceratitis capitata]